ncbi:hypothetical protein GDO81_026500 [Engystomops pustulosus]|uniref:Uncharacterized protein n=1 Tax=Engystomops pustulosus TaxID=76066 RepID=A0AAV6ZQ87_ENGPU|nr:hypothetical protein GDO81_026500 [Engystomops pustulosus]
MKQNRCPTHGLLWPQGKSQSRGGSTERFCRGSAQSTRYILIHYLWIGGGLALMGDLHLNCSHSCAIWSRSPPGGPPDISSLKRRK